MLSTANLHLYIKGGWLQPHQLTPKIKIIAAQVDVQAFVDAEGGGTSYVGNVAAMVEPTGSSGETQLSLQIVFNFDTGLGQFGLLLRVEVKTDFMEMELGVKVRRGAS